MPKAKKRSSRPKLTVKKKSYSYKRKGKTVRVKAATFKVKDRGKRGRAAKAQ